MALASVGPWVLIGGFDGTLDRVGFFAFGAVFVVAIGGVLSALVGLLGGLVGGSAAIVSGRGRGSRGAKSPA